MGGGTEFARRSFLKGAGILAVGASVAGLAGCSSWGSSSSAARGLPESWDGETDILIVGAGGAGIAAAITAASEKLGEALVLEAASADNIGGNLRVSAGIMLVPKTVEGAVTYLKNLNGPYVVADELMQAWAVGICDTVDWLGELGIETSQSPYFSPEWPEVDGSEYATTYIVGEGIGKQQLWNELYRVANELNVQVVLQTRARELVVNKDTGEVVGIRAEDAEGTSKYYKARKGVVLACGGFENNPEMMREYYQSGYGDLRPQGTVYNVGDGIKMAQAVGADLWHMNSYANSDYNVLAGGLDSPLVTLPVWANKDYVFISPDGKRYMYEETASFSRHGKYRYNGVATELRAPCPAWAVFGSKTFNGDCVLRNKGVVWTTLAVLGGFAGATNQEYLDLGVIVKGDTLEELAKKIGVDPATFAQTISDYNTNAAAGVDPDFNRGTSYALPGSMSSVIKAFSLEQLEGPYYAVQLFIGTYCTLGGPKRSSKNEVMNTMGKAVPRLYAVGELGDITSYLVNAGGGIAGALASGRVAARSIAALEPISI
ncbi:MAG: FAD-binding protein [Coriobacteriia bacterium]